MANSTLTKYQSVVGEINYIVFLLLIAVLPYSDSLSRPLWIVWMCFWAFELRFTTKPDFNGKRYRKLIPFIGFTVWFAISSLSVLWASNKAEAGAYLMRRADYIFLLLIAIWGVNDKYDWRTCMRVLIATCLISVFVYLTTYYWVMNHAHATDSAQPLVFSFDWLHLGEFTLNIKHRLQYSTLLCASVIGICLLFEDNVKRYGRVRTIIFSLSTAAILLLAIIWSGSREGIINIMVLAVTLLIIYAPRRHRWAYGAVAGIAIVGFAVGTLLLHPRFNEAPLKEYFQLRDYPDWPAYEPRLAIWTAALESPSDYSLHGVGVGNAPDYLVEKYTEHGWIYYIENRYHAHNEFLTQWIELGVVGMMLIAAIWLIMPFCFSGRSKTMAFLLTEICILNMLTDNFLDMIEGVFFVAVMFSIVLIAEQQQQTKAEN